MNEFLLVLGIASLTAFLTFLGAPLAERVEVSPHVISGALQFAAGVIMALVAYSLMPPAVLSGYAIYTVIMFFLGGSLYV